MPCVWVARSIEPKRRARAQTARIRPHLADEVQIGAELSPCCGVDRKLVHHGRASKVLVVVDAQVT